VPFASTPRDQTILISNEDFTSLSNFFHKVRSKWLSFAVRIRLTKVWTQNENYQMYASIYVDRESLLKKRKATVFIRPRLYINDTPASLKILEECSFSIVSFDGENVKSSKEISNFELYENRESTFEFQVADNVQMFEFSLKAKVRVPSQNEKMIDLNSTHRIRLNELDSTDAIQAEHLLHSDTGYRVMVLGECDLAGFLSLF